MEVRIGWEKKKTASEWHGPLCIGRRAKLDQGKKVRQGEVKERLIRADTVDNRDGGSYTRKTVLTAFLLIS